MLFNLIDRCVQLQLNETDIDVFFESVKYNKQSVRTELDYLLIKEKHSGLIVI